ncbi:MAG: hypothetical protein QOH09_2996 [Pseudonocardiales bacterium]|jgi:hypothetical protein|nr:hypothetical protein [Pseudonocardiales bacterium]
MSNLVTRVETQSNTCALYTSTRQRNDVLVPFLLEGLCRGEKCLVWLTDSETDDVMARLGCPDTVKDWLVSGQLEVHSPADPTLFSNAFWIDDMVALWEDVVSAAVTIGGFDFARIIAEANWHLPQPRGHGSLIRYEAMLNSISARYPITTLSLYDVSTPHGGLIFDLVRTHPRILLGDIPLENFHYVVPEQSPIRRAGPRTRRPSPAVRSTSHPVAV